jgi:hypothetical protein
MIQGLLDKVQPAAGHQFELEIAESFGNSDLILVA